MTLQSTFSHSSMQFPSDLSFKPTKEFASELSWFASKIIRTLADLAATFQYEENGLKLVYGVDFDVIYAYANPWSRNAFQANLVRYLIEQDKTPLVLLPGTIEELSAFIQYSNRKVLEIDQVVNYLRSNKATAETIEAANRLYRNQPLADTGSSRQTNLEELTQALVETGHHLTVAVFRIDRLINSNRFIALNEVFPPQVEKYFDEDIASRVQTRLSTWPGRGGEKNERRNRADAYNLATVVQHTYRQNLTYQQDPNFYNGYFLRLLTNTRCVLEDKLQEYAGIVPQQRSGGFPSITRELSNSFAVRNVFDASSAAATAQICKNKLHNCREKVSAALAEWKRLDATAIELNDFALSIQYHEKLDFDRFQRIYYDLMSSKYIRTHITDEWFSSIKELILIDAREQENKLRLSSDDSAWYDNQDTPEILNIPTEEQVDKRNEIQRHSLTKINSQKLNLGSETERIKKLGFFPREINLEGENAPKRWVIENVYLPLDEREVFTLEFSDGVFYGTWPCHVTESDVALTVDRLFHKEDGMLSDLDYSGEMHLLFAEENDSVLFARLPLQYHMTIKDYLETLGLLFDQNTQTSSGIPTTVNHDKIGSGNVPVAITCDTTLCSIIFDVMKFKDEGISIAFKNKVGKKIVYELFSRLSPWGYGSIVSDTICKILDDAIQNRLEVWA